MRIKIQLPVNLFRGIFGRKLRQKDGGGDSQGFRKVKYKPVNLMAVSAPASIHGSIGKPYQSILSQISYVNYAYLQDTYNHLILEELSPESWCVHADRLWLCVHYLVNPEDTNCCLHYIYIYILCSQYSTYFGTIILKQRIPCSFL